MSVFEGGGGMRLDRTIPLHETIPRESLCSSCRYVLDHCHAEDIYIKRALLEGRWITTDCTKYDSIPDKV
jgi:hypothetical protein